MKEFPIMTKKGKEYIPYDIIKPHEEQALKNPRIYDQKAVEKGIRLEVDWEKCSVRYPILLGNPVYFGRILREKGKRDSIKCKERYKHE